MNEQKNVLHQERMKSSIVNFTLDNGLKVFIKQIPHYPLVLILPWINAGSNNETEEIAGISHFIEHLLFKGTSKRGKGQLAEEIESLGGGFDAFTGNCFTAYYVLVPSENFSKALEIQFDQVTNPSFPQEEIDRERKVVLEEIRISNDLPTRQIFDNLKNTAFSKHRNGRAVLGYKEVVEDVTRDRIVSYYSNYYKPNNASLIICGDVKVEEIRPQIEKVYGAWQRGDVKFDKSPGEPIQKEFRKGFKTMDIKENFIGLGFKMPKFMHPDTLSLEVLSYLLVECGESAVLVDSLKHKRQLMSEIHSYLFSNIDAGLFTILGTQSYDKSPKDAAIAIIEELQLLKGKGITSSDLEKAKNYALRKQVSKIENISRYGVELGVYNCYGDYRYIEEYADKISKVTSENILLAMDKYFNLENLTAFELLPKEKNSTIVVEDIKKSFKPINKQEIIHEKLLVEKRKGYKLILDTRHYIPKVSAVILFKCGSAYENRENNGISTVLLESLFRGTKLRSAEEIAIQLDRTGTVVRKDSKKEYCYILVEMLPRYFRSCMEIILDCLINPTFPDKEIERQKQIAITKLHTIEDMPVFFSRGFFEKIYFGEHPYGNYELGVEDVIKNLKREDIVNWHKKFVSKDNIIISIVGDITKEEVIPVTDKFLSKLQDGEIPEIPAFTSEKRNLFGEKSQEREQSHIIVGGEFLPYGNKEYEFDIIKNILGLMSGRLFKHLRDEQSLAYMVRPYQNCLRKHGIYGVYIGTKPSQEQVAKDGIINELKNLVGEYAKPEEIAKAKGVCITEYYDIMQNFVYAGFKYAVNECYDKSALEINSYPDKIKNVSEEDIKKLIKKYICPEKTTIAIIHGK